MGIDDSARSYDAAVVIGRRRGRLRDPRGSVGWLRHHNGNKLAVIACVGAYRG